VLHPFLSARLLMLSYSIRYFVSLEKLETLQKPATKYRKGPQDDIYFGCIGEDITSILF